MRASAVQRILGMLHQGVKRVMKCLWVLYHCSHAISWGFTFQTGSVQSYQFNDTTRVIVTWSYLQVLQSSMESSNHPLAESWTMWSHLSGHLGDVSGLGIWKWSVVICGHHKQTCWMFPELFTSCYLAFVPFPSLSIHFLHRFCIRQDMLEEGIGVMASVWMGNPHHYPLVLRQLCGNSPLF